MIASQDVARAANSLPADGCRVSLPEVFGRNCRDTVGECTDAVPVPIQATIPNVCIRLSGFHLVVTSENLRVTPERQPHQHNAQQLTAHHLIAQSLTTLNI